jgi:putative endonuclease
MSANQWQVYLVRCNDGTLYCGIASNLLLRLAAHNAGLGAKYTRGRRPVKIVEYSDPMSHSKALRLEKLIKGLPKGEKARALYVLGVEEG